MSRVITKSHKQYEIGVKALITDKRRVLMLRRTDFDTWEVPGGRINEGEDIRTALQRELAEEISARKTSIKDIAHCQEVDFTLPNGNYLMLLFFNVSTDVREQVTLSSEHREFRWVTSGDLDKLHIQPAIRQAVLNVIAA